ncbi:hypothetical protein GPECTOR_81g225 [Gonium pectorale]|uniref:Uncharacterized protein n=1 Tax=Gonium pectorale TaxID=33097 RepID=A0A150G2N6_GONPE|nr:hypothetical protein GPECTOR_81g225 [Gonium pectorale]|eukprot:KXZ43775.1 hypothetical protein GPECTOR_81g225 [Gonium pectorale]
MPLSALGPLGEALDEAGVEAALSRYLPRCLGPAGGPLLLLLGRLHRLRPAAARLALLHCLAAPPAWAPSAATYLQLLRTLWEPAMEAHRDGRLTVVESEGLPGLMAAFLQRALPLLANHYEALGGEDAIPCLALLLEMVGWALTWDPGRSPPPHLLTEPLLRAAAREAERTRAAAEAAEAELDAAAAAGPAAGAGSKPAAAKSTAAAAAGAAAAGGGGGSGSDALAGFVVTVAEAAERAAAQLERDVQLAEAVPGLGRRFLRSAAGLRYGALRGALAGLFRRRPGRSGAASTGLWQLEGAVAGLHTAMIRHGAGGREHGLAVEPESANGAAPPPQRKAAAAASSSAPSTPPRPRPVTRRRGAPASSSSSSSDDDDVSPLSSGVASSSEGEEEEEKQRGGGGGRRRNGGGAVADAAAAADSGSGTDCDTDSGSEGEGDDGADVDDGGGGGGRRRVVLFDLEGAMTGALAEWAEMGAPCF